MTGGQIKSWVTKTLSTVFVVQVMYKDDKKYHMDLKENARGRFLKVSETFTRGYSRFQVRSQVKKK